MITIKSMRWGNAFSYGPDNSISFVDSPITQLVGSNGHGKSSIALLIEECLYNKNSKGVKKGDILNRYTDAKKYWIELAFDKDGIEYVVRTDRSSTTQSVKLTADGVDISSHTSTGTYKMIEELLGMDHKTFAQIVYQSHAGSLEFLTSTDSVRKKFLVELLNLEKYSKLGEKFKALSLEAEKVLAKKEASLQSASEQLAKLRATKHVIPEEVLVPEDISGQLNVKLHKLRETLDSIIPTNTAIRSNNANKLKLAKLKTVEPPPEAPIGLGIVDTTELTKEIATLEANIRTEAAFIAKMSALHGTCATCLSEINEDTTHKLIEASKDKCDTLSERLTAAKETLSASKALNTETQRKTSEYTAAKSAYEKYVSERDLLVAKIRNDLPDVEHDASEIEAEIDEIEQQIKTNRDQISKANAVNNSVAIAKAKAQMTLEQIAEVEPLVSTLTAETAQLQARVFRLQTLSKAFSNSGLIAYKIESMIKDLEDITNEYLSDLSDGRFSLSFQIAASDKLAVVVNDNGEDIDINALSGGERARVNAATLLAIRRLMQSLSGNRINLLILDETIEAIDQHGKEKLIEVLIKQDHLNTFLISHGFSHPLLDKIFIVKQQNQSRLEK